MAKFEEGNEAAKDHWFKPGESGNPAGRPKGTENSKTRLLRFLELEMDGINPATGEQERGTVLEMMDAALIQKALKGDAVAYREILDRFEGKVLNRHDHTSGGEKTSFLGFLMSTNVVDDDDDDSEQVSAL